MSIVVCLFLPIPQTSLLNRKTVMKTAGMYKMRLPVILPVFYPSLPTVCKNTVSLPLFKMGTEEQDEEEEGRGGGAGGGVMVSTS